MRAFALIISADINIQAISYKLKEPAKLYVKNAPRDSQSILSTNYYNHLAKIFRFAII